MTNPWVQEPWAEAYRLVLSEINPTRLPKRIKTAEIGIMERIEELKGPEDHTQELVSLFDALKRLRLLDGNSKRRRQEK